MWGMGSMFSGGNTNTLVKINDKNISTQEFIDFLNNSGIPQETIRENLNNNIIEELLSNLVSTTLLELEVEDFYITITEKTLLKKIKENKNFLDENGNFQRIKYEKFLIENNQSAPQFEQRLKNRELQKNLFDYIGAGTISPDFLINRLFEEDNKKLEIEFINLEKFYKKKEMITDKDIKDFLLENKDNLKVEYLDFKYAIINPKNLVGVNEFNQAYFDKIDKIEVDISNEIEFKTIVNKFNINSVKVSDFKFSPDKNKIEQKIFELRNNSFDIFENGDDYILYKIDNISQREPNINDNQTRNEIIELVFQKNKFKYNNDLLQKIEKKEFNNNEFIKMGQNSVETSTFNSVRDNKKFDINSVEILYSLPINSFTLINDEKNNIYLAKIKNVQTQSITDNKNEFDKYLNKQDSNIKNSMLSSYDLYLNNKYDVVLNQKTIERVKNFFK
tara:strand:- start:676 stop:2016 length:1341 start_codon:yes stop_codon:yes gene_type:complete